MRAIVFAGPSVFGLDRNRRLAAEMRPPAVCGDILRACTEGVHLIGLIDGCFESCPAVWHKEILAAIAKGICVFGAASMGALRAAECAAFGMVGIGRIFHDYFSGARQSDADVAVLHAPAELAFAPLTVALVNIEATMRKLQARGNVTTAEASVLMKAAREIHFKDRTWKNILNACAFTGDRSTVLLEKCVQYHVDQKALDAALLIDAIERWCATDARPERTSLSDFNRTVYLRNLERRIAGSHHHVAA